MTKAWLTGYAAFVAFMIGVPASSIAAQPSLTHGGFEQVANGSPVDWSPVVGHPKNRYEIGKDAHGGQRALRLLRVVDEGELGFNRAWRPDSGQQGAMLSQRKGGLAFWYKVVQLSDDAEMQFMAIPMNARPMEGTDSQRATYTVPRQYVGDGVWHRAVFKYDFTGDAQVKWVHVAGRLNSGTGEVLVDDVEYLPTVGPLVEITDLTVTTVGKPADEAFRVSGTVTSRGDRPAANVTVKLIPSVGSAFTQTKPAATPGALGIDEQRTLTWDLRGRRLAGHSLAVTVSDGKTTTSQIVEMCPKLDVRLVPDASILFGDRTVGLTLEMINTGSAAARDVRRITTLSPAGTVALRDGSAPLATTPILLPGQVERATWQVAPLRDCQRARVSVMISSAQIGVLKATQEFVCLAGMGKSRPADVRWRARGVELVLHGGGFGHGAASVYAIATDAGKQARHLVGRIPRAGRVILPGPMGVVDHPLAPDTDETIDFFGEPSTTPAEARIVARSKDKGGATWTLTIRFAPGPADGLIRATYELQCDQDRAIRAFEGPIVWAGAGSFGAEKRDAVVPGIEWLVGDEVSSSDLDFEPTHRYRMRYVPHPNELTWPIMAVVHKSVGIGLMWDPQQRFDGERRGPQPVFASPDRFSHRNHHLMGLILPTVREMEKRNVRRSPKPIAIKAGTPWTITADLWVSATARDSLAALDTWMDVHDLPAPLPPPRGDWAKEIGFSMAAYLKTLYDAEADGWRWCVGGPSAMQGKPGPSPALGYDVWMGSHLAASADVRRRCAEMVDRLFAKRNRPVSVDDLGYVMGRPDHRLAAWATGASQHIHRQGPDGEWRFDADLRDEKVFVGFDYHELGQDNAVELGLCARKAYEILHAARLTGDERAYRAALETLAFMKRFEVPRAAQVWEVPVHSPDILAAADAIDAYLEAYQIDGNPDHLAQAVRWARAGLPFVYVWHTPEFPWMHYGSIPVFGASWMKWSWIANVVQWNGLRYGYALIKLARVDKSRPWRRIAEGLTVSAMYQQHTDGKLEALWPDSLRVDGPGRSGWEFAPRLILKNVYALMGRDEIPTSHRIRGVEGLDDIVLSVMGRFERVERAGETLNVDVELPDPYSSWLVVAGTARPKTVTVDGKAVSALPGDTPTVRTPGHLYRTAMNLLMVALPTPGKHRIALTGLARRPSTFVPEIRTTIDFEFDRDGDLEGWQAAHDVSDLTVQAGQLTFTTTGSDPYIIRPGLDIPPDQVKAIVIRMSVTRGANAQLFWSTQASPAFDEPKSIAFPLVPGPPHDYRLDLATHPHWKGQHITGIRIDPTGQAGASIAVQSIE